MLNIKVIASGSSGNSYLVQDQNKHKLLIECGIPFQQLMKGINFDLAGLDGCLVTHEHKDHSKSIKELLNYGVAVYCSQGTADACDVADNSNVHIIAHDECDEIAGTWAIWALKAEHDAAEPLMFIIGNDMDRLLFATDTYFIQYKIHGLTHVMLECNYAMDILNENIDGNAVDGGRKHRLLYSHMNIDTAKQFFRDNNWPDLQKIMLIHLSKQNSDAERFIADIEKITGVPVEVA